MRPVPLSIPLLIMLFNGLVTSAQTWTPLFNGQNLAGWATSDGKPVTTGAWEVRDGALHLDHANGQGGNLLTQREFGDFELVFEWKVAPKANNGIKYRVRDFDGSTLGIEYQVIDDYGNPDLDAKHKAASIYDIVAARRHAHLRPADEFNRGRIVVHNNRIEHWLNGHLIATANVGSDQWRAQIGDSKFSDVDGFGMNHSGRIMLTDHHDEVTYRNIFIREFETTSNQSADVTFASANPTSSFVTTCCCKRRASPRRRLFGRRRAFR